MNISLEISYYPLTNKYSSPIREFIDGLGSDHRISVQLGPMSTLISGDYDTVMQVLISRLRPLMEKYPSVFTMKLSNACKISGE
ncbi:MAG TPA: hypothetical protein ENN63_01785 [Bacteroidetes bacterium]|nr:hypothetical protein [Bacteroidota bacterium]